MVAEVPTANPIPLTTPLVTQLRRHYLSLPPTTYRARMISQTLTIVQVNNHSKPIPTANSIPLTKPLVTQLRRLYLPLPPTTYRVRRMSQKLIIVLVNNYFISVIQWRILKYLNIDDA